MRNVEVDLCRSSLAEHSKSFALAARLFPRRIGDRAAVVYAWCRRADDAVDRAPTGQARAAVRRLRAELDGVYRGRSQADPVLAAFQRVAVECSIPRSYADELIAGMEMDCEDRRYDNLDALLTYCFRVAGTVGLMMCHVMGLRDPRALRRAAHLGIAMQLTNICRDVLEDWNMGRLYLPGDLLGEHGAPDLEDRLGGPFPSDARAPAALVVRQLLAEADEYYGSGDAGLAALSWRCAFAIRAARLIYAAIGRRVERSGCDVTAGRAIVPLHAKLGYVGRACVAAAVELPRRARTRFEPIDLDSDRDGLLVRFPEDVLPV